MPGRRLNLSHTDRRALYTFFSDRTYKDSSPYLRLKWDWKSTSQISKELNESWKRTLKRLEKLSGFGLLEPHSVTYKERMDHYWWITIEGLYYVLSTLEHKELIQFLRSNKKEVESFSYIEELALKNNVQISYLKSQIKNIVSNYQYFQLKYFIERWLFDNFGSQITAHFYHPSIVEMLKRNYCNDKEFLQEMSKVYGKIE